MKDLFKKIASFIMAIVVLFSTMSFTINSHYCGDTLVDTAIFNEVKTCGMEMQKPDSNSGCSITKKDCCKDEIITLKGQDELQLSVDKIPLEQQVFITSFIVTYNTLFTDYLTNNILQSEYPPPRIVKTIYKLDETYLI